LRFLAVQNPSRYRHLRGLPLLIPVILSGGAGTRPWPVSREAHPKPFIVLPDWKEMNT
jgi:mannose-1-phosphate guanylyltransferase